MSYPIEQAAIREPTLWARQHKPIGPVKIDWNNPLSNKLRYAWYITQTGRLLELAKHRFTDITKTGIADYRIGEMGLCIAGTGGTNDWFSDVSSYVTDADFSDDNASMIVFCTATNNIAQGGHCLQGSSQKEHYSYSGTLYTSAFRANRVNNTRDTTILNDPHFTCWVQDFTNDSYNVYQKPFRGGAESLIISTTSGSAWTFNSVKRIGRNHLTNYFPLDDTAGSGPNNELYLTLVWNRALNAGEREDFYSDPYQLLIPA